MKCLLFGQAIKPEDQSFVNDIAREIEAQNFKPTLYHGIAESVNAYTGWPVLVNDDPLKKGQFDLIISFGGDGTMLKAAILTGPSEVPLLGINLGRLGFLATTDRVRAKRVIQEIKQGLYAIEARTTLKLSSSASLFGQHTFALNDFTILKRDNSSMIKITAYINKEYFNTYWADGLIVSTPTGSTGYSLSCGGPIVLPQSNNFIITPVAPHNLTARPTVIPDDSVLTFEVEGRSENFLCTLDSRFATITSDQELQLQKNDFPINLIKPHKESFLKTLREKLNWGKDIRN